MSLIGESVTIAGSTDPTKLGRTGLVVMETAKTLLIETGGRVARVEKHGAAFTVSGSGEVVLGDDISGKPEDRVGGRRK